VPPRIRRALEKGLAPRPEQRFESMQALLAELERDPSRRRAVLGVVAGAVVLMAGAAGWIVLDRSRAQAACEAEGAAIAEVWNDDARERVRAGLTAASPELGASTAERVEPRLDAYASAWQTARTEACVAATIEESVEPSLATAATSCLDERLARLGGFVDLLAEARSDDIWDATESASKLPPVDRCNDETWLRLRPVLPADPEARQQVEDVRAELQRGLPLSATRPGDAVKWLAATLENTEAVGWPPLVAEAQLDYGGALASAGEYAEAEAMLLDAYLNALAAGDDALAADAAGRLTTVVGYFLARHDEGLVWGRTGETLSKRIGNVDSHLQARLLSAIGLVHLERGDFDAALDHHMRSRALWEETVGAQHTAVAREDSNVGLALWRQGRFAEAVEAYEHALVLWEAAVGPQNPAVAVVLNNLGSVAMDRGELDEAEKLLRRALEIRAATLGVKHTTYASTLSNLGSVLQSRGRIEEALEHFERALEILRAELGDEHPRIAQLYSNIGLAYLSDGRYPEAEEPLRRSIEIIEKSLGPEHVNVWTPLANLASVSHRRGRPEEAKAQAQRAIEVLEHGLGPDHPSIAYPLATLAQVALDETRYEEVVVVLERALSIHERVGTTGASVASVQLNLASALHELGRDPERVRSLLTAARPAAPAVDVPTIDAFLRKLDR
jgi:tetratricopeptide (TPR) repeat protein